MSRSHFANDDFAKSFRNKDVKSCATPKISCMAWRTGSPESRRCTMATHRSKNDLLCHVMH
jgi:hypothetical protein